MWSARNPVGIISNLDDSPQCESNPMPTLSADAGSVVLVLYVAGVKLRV